MGNDSLILDDFFWDDFTALLTEDELPPGAFYTEAELREEIRIRIVELNRLGYQLSPDMITVQEIRSDALCTAGVGPVAEHKYKFVIAKLALRKKNAKYLDTIIYHELCHILQLEYLFDQHIIFYENGKLKGDPVYKNLIDLWYIANSGHTPLWFKYVERVNTLLHIEPPIEQELRPEDLATVLLEDYDINDLDPNYLWDYFPEVMS